MRSPPQPKPTQEPTREQVPSPGHVVDNSAVYLSPAEVARRTGLSIATVRRYVQGGALPKYQPGGRRCRVMIPIAALESFQSATSTEGTSTPSTSRKEEALAKEQRPRFGPRPRWTRCT